VENSIRKSPNNLAVATINPLWINLGRPAPGYGTGVISKTSTPGQHTHWPDSRVSMHIGQPRDDDPASGRPSDRDDRRVSTLWQIATPLLRDTRPRFIIIQF
jgi:hypothetical protein